MKEKKKPQKYRYFKMWKRTSQLQTRFSYNVTSLRDTAVWNIVPDPKRTGEGGEQKAGGEGPESRQDLRNF